MNTDHDIETPAPLTEVVRAVCERFDLSGHADPGFIANTVAVNLGCGDGRGRFDPLPPAWREHLERKLDTIARQLQSTCQPIILAGEVRALKDLIASTLFRVSRAQV